MLNRERVGKGCDGRCGHAVCPGGRLPGPAVIRCAAREAGCVRIPDQRRLMALPVVERAGVASTVALR